MAEASHPPKQRTVLVVDDVSVDRKILSKCLERDGYSVSLAYDGRQALQLLRAQQGSIDLVLIDVNMPVMNGFETLSRIKSSPELWHIPVILMSSDDKADDGVSPALVRSISLGAADFLQKPITPSVLRSKLKELFQPTSVGPRIQNSVTVLCIDDQPVVRRTVVKCLTKAGYAVETAQDGLEALEFLQKRHAESPTLPPVDIILLDLFMPRMNGKELLVKLKAHNEWANIPVLIMTSDDDTDTADAMLSLGADDCLKKPLGEGLLKKRISKALESNRIRMWVAKLWSGRQNGASGSSADDSGAPSPSTASIRSSIPSFSSEDAAARDPGHVVTTAVSGEGGMEDIIAKNPTPPIPPTLNTTGTDYSEKVAHSRTGSSITSPPAEAMITITKREFDNYEKLKVDSKDFRRRLKEKHARVAQLEAVLVDVSRTLEAERSTTQQLQRQVQVMSSHERELRILLTHAEQRVSSLVKEAAERGYIPCMTTPKIVPPSMVSQELQEVFVRADVLFNSCPDCSMTIHREELVTLTHEVCGYPTYFARPLFEAVIMHGVRIGRRDADSSAGPIEGQDYITLEDFMGFWQELVESHMCDHIGKFWFLVRQPGCDHIYPEDMRPLIKALVDYHMDLSSFRADANLQEAYITTVLISIFCSLHGQRESKISLAELKGSNLVDAFDLVSTQSTRNIRPFCVAYFEEIFTRFRRLDRSGIALVRYHDLVNSRDVKITNFMLDRVFAHYPRRLACDTPGCMSFADFVWFWLAEKDGMTDTSISYWFRCLDLDNDGFLGVEDLLSCYAMKIHEMQEAGLSVTSLLSPYDVMCQVTDAINPKTPGLISCLDLKRSNNAAVLFDVFVVMANTGPVITTPTSDDNIKM